MLDDKVKELKLKPFDLATATAGATIVTRTGRAVRVLCTDAACHGALDGDDPCSYPIVALVEDPVLGEYPQVYAASGKFWSGAPHELDLFIVPTKRAGWINIYPPPLSALPHVAESSNVIYRSKAAADANARHNRIDCVLVEWEA